MNRLFLLLADDAGTGSSSTSSSTEKLTETLKSIVASPVFYIVIGAIVLLIIAFYLLRRLVKPSQGVIKVVTRGGNIYKLIDENSEKHFLVPFKESLGAVISLNEKSFSSDKLFINNGPDALYKVNYTLSYKVNDAKAFFPYRDNFQNVVITKINDVLREYADNGHALDIVKDYREHNKELLDILNKVTSPYGVEVLTFKINYIEPFLGK